MIWQCYFLGPLREQTEQMLSSSGVWCDNFLNNQSILNEKGYVKKLLPIL